MSEKFTYGVVIDGVFYSNRAEIKIRRGTENGIYSMDMEQDDFKSSLAPADIAEATKYFRKSSKIRLIRGTSFHDGIVPENPVAYSKIPIKIPDANFGEFEHVLVVSVKGKIFYTLEIPDSPHAYVLMDLRERLESKGWKKIDDIKGITPDMRLVYMFHALEKKRKEMEEPVNAITSIMISAGAKVISVKKSGRHYTVLWEAEGHVINTLLDSKYHVIECGFCVSGYDRTQSAHSVVNLLKDYVEDGDHVHITRTVD